MLIPESNAASIRDRSHSPRLNLPAIDISPVGAPQVCHKHYIPFSSLQSSVESRNCSDRNDDVGFSSKPSDRGCICAQTECAGKSHRSVRQMFGRPVTHRLKNPRFFFHSLGLRALECLQNTQPILPVPANTSLNIKTCGSFRSPRRRWWHRASPAHTGAQRRRSWLTSEFRPLPSITTPAAHIKQSFHPLSHTETRTSNSSSSIHYITVVKSQA